MTDDSKRIDTRLVTGGRRKAWTGRLVSPPVERASTLIFDSVEQMRTSRPAPGTYVYGLQGTTSQWALREALADIDPGAAGVALASSGLAAVTTALLAVLQSGDELLMVDSAYIPTRQFCDGTLKKMGVTTRYYDPLASAEEVAALAGDRTRAIFLESPGSLSFEVQDVPGIAAMARDRGIVTLLDNTWATPLLFPAFAHGVDISILALTKHVGGHSDLLMGAISSTQSWADRVERTVFELGQSVSPDDAWLALRGLRTLGLRLKRHEASSLELARWLQDHPKVGAIRHPAFDGCPGHAYWRRDFAGSSGLFAFALKDANKAGRDAFVDRLRIFGLGYSWGGFESLAVPADPVRTATAPDFGGPLVRIHAGLEDPADLIADLDQAFAET
ncbi:cystathionine beta-lyase [Sphingomonas sabuli]|uniref:cystathionine beta-lyase n=1 Tax=Sphingomonas sabuli TaxID=2764186 RepID=UPI003CCDF9E6